MNGQELTVMGEALHGARWQTKLANQVGLSSRAIRQYLERDAVPEPTARLIELLHWCKVTGVPLAAHLRVMKSETPSP